MTRVWLRGEVVEADQATVGALDHGLTTGDGLFETMKVVRGEAFALTRHLARLHRSADAMGIAVPLGDDGLRAAVRQLLDATPTAGKVRITVTAGPGPLGSGRDHVPATVVVAAAPLDPWAPASRVATSPWPRNERSPLAGVKSTSYAENVLALRQAKEQGADEAILCNTLGHLCEGTGSNLFLVRGGRLLTPSLATGCLAGITRELLLELVEVEERDDLTLGDLTGADEVFITSSTRDVHPVASIDGEPTPQAPGPVTAAAAAALAEAERRSTDP